MFVIFKNQKGIDKSLCVNPIVFILILLIRFFLHIKLVLAKILDDILSEWNDSLENSNYYVVEKYANISKNISVLSLLISWTVCVMGCLAQVIIFSEFSFFIFKIISINNV